MNVTRTVSIVVVAGALVIAGHGRAWASVTPAAPPDLRGRWMLDHRRSDDPRQKFEEAMPGQSPGQWGGGMSPGGMPGGGMPGGGGRGGGRSGGGAPRGMDDAEGDGPREAPPDLDQVAHAMESFTLDQLGDTLAFVNRGVRVRQVIVNGGRNLPSSTSHGVEQASAHWKKDRLVVERRGPDNQRIVEHWELLDDGKALRCTTNLSLGPTGPIELVRVYVHPSEDAAGAAEPDGTRP